jgi:hypothetical protein
MYESTGASGVELANFGACAGCLLCLDVGASACTPCTAGSYSGTAGEYSFRFEVVGFEIQHACLRGRYQSMINLL